MSAVISAFETSGAMSWVHEEATHWSKTSSDAGPDWNRDSSDDVRNAVDSCIRVGKSRNLTLGKEWISKTLIADERKLKERSSKNS